MRIGVIGGGGMGTGLGRAFARKGHEVFVGSREPGRGRDKAQEIGATGGGGYREAAEFADVLLFTVPWWSVSETLQALGNLDGKILVDVTNPYKDETYTELHQFPGSSGAEKIQASTEGAKVVKAWNHVFAQIVSADDPVVGGDAPAVFLAGDDDRAKQTVSELARELGYDPVDTGPLSSARYLEPFAGLMVTLGYRQGLGPVAFKLLRYT